MPDWTSNILADLSLATILFAAATVLLAGFIKGVSGFALPLTMVAGLTLILPAETVVAMIAFPALVTNFLQARRAGLAMALATLRQYWLLNLILVLTVFASTWLVVTLDERSLFLVVGSGGFVFSVLQVLGRPRHLPENWQFALQAPFGLVAGVLGGIAGIWGVALVNYFLALRISKPAFVQALGVTYFVACIPYIAGHVQTGVLNTATAPLSLLALIPALLGLRLGIALQDRLDPVRFRQIVLIILLLITLNLVRRGLWG